MSRHSMKAILACALLLLGFAASDAALAQHRGGVRFGVYVGVPLYGSPYYPGYYPPYYPPPYYYPPYYPPAVMAPAAPPVYIEQSVPPAAPAPAQPQAQAQAQAPADWYYCAASKGYYPYEKECPAGWQRVPAQPPAR